MLQNMIRGTFLPVVQAHQQTPELPNVSVHSVSTPHPLPSCWEPQSCSGFATRLKRDQVIPHLGNVPDNILLKDFSPGPWLAQHIWSFGKDTSFMFSLNRSWKPGRKNILIFLVQYKTLILSEFSSCCPPTTISMPFGRLWSVLSLPVFKQNRLWLSGF